MHNSLALIDEPLVDSQGNPVFGGDLIVRDQEILFIVFIAILIALSILAFLHNYSLIPILGALCCLYLMIEIPAISWLWFFVWMGAGLTIYFIYGRKNSRLSE